jgi:hypothetical protein
MQNFKTQQHCVVSSSRQPMATLALTLPVPTLPCGCTWLIQQNSHKGAVSQKAAG